MNKSLLLTLVLFIILSFTATERVVSAEEGNDSEITQNETTEILATDQDEENEKSNDDDDIVFVDDNHNSDEKNHDFEEPVTEDLQDVDPVKDDHEVETQDSSSKDKTVIERDYCGTNAIYTIYDDYSMVISGSGKINDYTEYTYITSSFRQIRSLTIGNGITSIGKYAFHKFSALQFIQLPISTTMASNSFDEVENVAEVQFTKGTGTAVNYTSSTYQNTPWYKSRDKLYYIWIYNDVESIGDYTFYNCYKVMELVIPTSVTSIGNNVFHGCSGLTSIQVSTSNTKYDSRDNCNALIETSTNKLLLGTKKTVIPNSVTSIGFEAFYNCTGLSSVTIPDSVTSIEDYAFYGCSGLTSLTMPISAASCQYSFKGVNSLYNVHLTKGTGKGFDYNPNSFSNPVSAPWYESRNHNITFNLDSGITYIGSSAFYNCVKIRSFIIPDSVTSIRSDTFHGCTGLTSISIPSNVKTIGIAAFEGCTSLASISFPDSIETIGGYAFDGCTSLTSLYIPASVTSIAQSSFEECTGLNSIVVAPDNAYYDSRDNCNALIETSTNKLITGTKNSFIPDSITSIGGAAFYKCIGLSSISIPDSIESVGYSAFYGCTGLTTLTMPFSVSFASNSFTDVANLESIHFTKGTGVGIDYTSDTYQNTPWYISRNNLTTMVFDEGITSIGNYTFYNCIKLDSIILPSTVTSIGDQAFKYCSGATTIVIPNLISSIGSQAFYGCSGLKSLTMPISYSISESQFNNVTKLRELHLTKGKTGTGAEYTSSTYQYTPWYKSKSTFTNLIIDDGIRSIGDYTFYNCLNIINLTMPISATIKQYSFYGAVYLENLSFTKGTANGINYTYSTIQYTPWRKSSNNLKTVNIESGIKSIGDYTFEYCSKVSEIDLPTSLTTIGKNAFAESGLTSVVIPKSVTSIGYNAFYGCSNLNSLTVIENNAKYDSRNDCNALIETSTNTLLVGTNQTVIPDSVTSIGDRAFYGLSELRTLIIPDSVTTIGDEAFSNCTGLISLIIPDSVTSIGYGPFFHCESLITLTISDSISELNGDGIFEGCENLTSLTMPVSLYAYIDGYQLPGLKTLHYTKGTGTGSGGAYWSGASSLEMVILDDGIESIANYTFDGTNLATIFIPNSINQIGKYGFTSIHDIYTSAPSKKTGWDSLWCSSDAVVHYNTSRDSYNQIVGLYNIIFDGNGATGGSTENMYCLHVGETYTLNANGFVKEGSTFGGWNLKKYGSGTSFDDGQSVSSDLFGGQATVTLYAQWIPNKYTVVFDSNGGTPIETQIVAHGSLARRPNSPSKDGYDFSNWYKGNTAYDFNTPVVSDMTLVAKWNLHYYLITYTMNDGELPSGTSNPTIYTIESKTITLNNPFKTGYTFLGWTGTELDGPTLEVTIPKGSLGNREYTANFEANRYNIYYELNGGTNHPDNILSHVYDDDPFVLLDPVKDYYSFEGWYLNDERIMVIPAQLNEDIVLEARWEICDYQIEYELNGGINNPGNPNGYNYESETIILLDPSKEGYVFEGWYREDTFENRISSITHNSHGDIKVYAKWRPVTYVVRFNLNLTPNETYNQLFVYDQEDNLVQNQFLVSGCIFKGWALTPDGDITFDDGDEVINLTGTDNGIVDLYAKWELKYTTSEPYPSIPQGSELEKGNRISLFCDDADSLIYYSVDGSEPENDLQHLYTESILIDNSVINGTDNTVIIKAFAVSKDKKDSGTVSFTYTVKEESYGDILPDDLIDAGIDSVEDIPEGIWTSRIHDFIYDPAVKSCVYDVDEVRVYYGSKLLVSGTDYTIKYSNNTKAAYKESSKAPSITVTGKGNYAGSLTQTFTIEQLVLSEEDAHVILNKDCFVYNGKVQKPSISSIEYKGIKLKNKTDYICFYDNSDSKDPHQDYGMTIYLMGNYAGLLHTSYSIIADDGANRSISSATVSGIKPLTYDDRPLYQEITVKDGKTLLTEGEDYTVSYSDNINAGTGYLVIEGINAYQGKITKSFKINPIALSSKNVNVDGLPESITYQGKYEPDALVKCEGKNLVKDVDYVVTYKNNDKAGTATVTYKGIGNYSGSLSKTFIITSIPLNDLIIEDIDDQHYLKGGSRPDVSIYDPHNDVYLKANRDYSLSYKNNTALGTAAVTVKLKGNYDGSVTKTFNIVRKNLSEVSLSIQDKVYSTKAGAWKSNPVLTDSDGKKLSAGTDYEKEIIYTYKYDTVVLDGSSKEKVMRCEGDSVLNTDILPHNTIVIATVRGKGNYNGTATLNYRIITSDISKASVSIPVQYYTGSPITLSKSDLTVKVGKEILSSQDYDIISYSNNTSKGTAKLTIKGKGNYGGTKTVKFTIRQRAFGNTIRFNSNGATSGSMKDQIIYKNTALSNCAFKKTGYTFMGWSLSPDGAADYINKAVFPYSIFKAGRTVNLYAVWE